MQGFRLTYANLFIVDTPHAGPIACPLASKALYEHLHRQRPDGAEPRYFF
jgi:hypothetical protein